MNKVERKKQLAELSAAIADSFLPLWQRVSQALGKRLSHFGLQVTQAECLMHVRHLGEQAEPAVLAEQMFLPRQTMTYILDQLERQNLVQRTPHPVDRRRKIIALTPTGEELATRILRDILTYEKTAAAHAFTPEQRGEIRAAVNKLAEILEELNETT